MPVSFLSLEDHDDLIDGVILHPLQINRDPRGSLMETLKSSWDGVVDQALPFGQTYCSVTLPGFARDEEKWHNHPTKQTDRFVVIKGSCVFALYDAREQAKTHGKLNLFLMGEMNSDANQYLLLIPKEVYHGFTTVGNEPCYLLGNPTHVYDPAEEERIAHADVPAKFSDGTPFSWQVIRDQFTNK